MAVIENRFKACLRAGRLQIGLWQVMVNTATAEVCAAAGFDWLLFDGEHAPNDLQTLAAQLKAVEPYAAHPIARPPASEAWMIKQYLDLGFSTLLVPLVDSAEQAEQVVRATRYPPNGIRGVGTGGARAARWNLINDYLTWADSQICVLVQVETSAGLSNVDAIAATEGVDGVFIGPSDLAASLGYRGNPAHPEVLAAVDHAIERIKAAGKAPGILAYDMGFARRCLERGCLFVAIGSDMGLFIKAVAGVMQECKLQGMRP